MRSLLWLVTGFAIPSVVVVTIMHLVKVATVGELIDGVAAGLLFTFCFAMGALFARTLLAAAVTLPAANKWVQLGVGSVAAVLTWLTLGYLWTLITTKTSLQPGFGAFAINIGIMVLSGMITMGLTIKAGLRRHPLAG